MHDLPRSKSSLVEERIEIVTEAIQTTSNETQSTSIRKVSNATGIPKSSVQRIMRTDLNLYPYKLQMLQKLNDEDKGARLNFSEWLRTNNDSVNNILWSDEAYFYLDGDISRHHCRIWTTSKPSHYLTKPLHPQKTCVWFAFSSKFKLQPFFFDSPINSESYLEMLRNNVRPQLAQKRKISSTIFMQDGAPSHYATNVRSYLNDLFNQRVISRGCKISWPPRSPDLNPLDYWFWGTLKARVFHNNAPRDLQTLKSRIAEECDAFTVGELAAAISNLSERCHLLDQVDGGHFEHLM